MVSLIQGLNPWGFSPIHAPPAQVAAHHRMMTGLFPSGQLVAGAFTFIPGRRMFEMVFG